MVDVSGRRKKLNEWRRAEIGGGHPPRKTPLVLLALFRLLLTLVIGSVSQQKCTAGPNVGPRQSTLVGKNGKFTRGQLFVR